MSGRGIWAVSICSPQILSNSVATLDFVGVSRVIHETVGVLSQLVSMVTKRMQTMPSSTRSWRMAAASSKSEFVIVPLGFASDMSWSLTCWGHWTLHTVEGMLLVPSNHTPPAPFPDASCVPM